MLKSSWLCFFGGRTVDKDIDYCSQDVMSGILLELSIPKQ